jgi:hypothetical protein
MQPIEGPLDQGDAFGRAAFTCTGPSEQRARPIAIVGKSVAIAEGDGGLRGFDQLREMAAPLIRQRRVCFRDHLTVGMIDLPRERDRLLGVIDRRIRIA